eukprot:7034130-Pyramimonas_sp.AAC.1
MLYPAVNPHWCRDDPKRPPPSIRLLQNGKMSSVICSGNRACVSHRYNRTLSASKPGVLSSLRACGAQLQRPTAV